MRGHLRRVLFVLALIAIWAAASSLVHRARPELAFLFPKPGEVGTAMLSALRGGTLLPAVARSLRRLLLGYALSLAGGTLLGIALARLQWLRDTAGVLVLGLGAIPSVCWMPLALLWFGFNDRAILLVVVLGALLSITIATENAVKNVPPIILRAARTMGARGFVLYRRVVLPAALPEMVSGARLGWTFAWRSLMAAELLFASGGLGQMLQTGRELHDMPLVVAVMVVIVLLGLASEQLVFARVERRVRARWGLDRR